MSAYYHASPDSQAFEQAHPGCLIDPGRGVMRNWFVGLLFALGGILILYKGFTRMEDWALNLAGVMALGVASFPMAWGADFKGAEVTVASVQFSLHGFCAVTLFLCIGYVCIFRACDTLELVHDPKLIKRYRRTYKWLGWAMIVFPVALFLLFSVFQQQNRATFFVELAGIWVFAFYWLVKDHEISKSHADRLAMCGELRVVEEPRVSPFRKVAIKEARPDDKALYPRPAE
ncbi:MAG TPA: hypothetical protein VGP63_15695 [Planctomycetaceae bacterium]|nr:hypothetical protein [Planctomycetaceae bacterium]